MNEKQRLQKRIEKLEVEEAKKQQDAIRLKNYKAFKNRVPDWMIGRAHADLDFINQKYSSDRLKSLLPVSVSVSGNTGHTYRDQAPVTDSTNTYFHNVWNDNYKTNESEFQDKLNALVQEEVSKITKQLPVVLEMFGLQSNRYWINENNFPKEKLKEIENDIQKAQAEILDTYSDEEFLNLIRIRSGWREENGVSVPKYPDPDVDLSHSRMILFRYIFSSRPSLWQAFMDCKFYKDHKDKFMPIKKK